MAGFPACLVEIPDISFDSLLCHEQEGKTALPNDIKIKLAYIFVDLIAPLVLGYLFRYQRRLGDRFFSNMMNNNILTLYPALSVLSFWVVRLDLELAWLPIFGMILGLIPGVTAYLWSAKKYSDYLERGSYIIAAILSNFGTLGGLCAFIIYGETGFAYVQLAVLLQNVVIFMFCFPLAQYYYHQSRNADRHAVSLTDLLLNKNQLPVLGLVIGASLYYLGVPRPQILGDLFNPLVHVAAWTALIPIGFSINLAEMRRYYWKIFDLIPIKFIVTPLIAYGLARLVISDQKVVNTLLILASTPTAINAVVIAKLHNLNVDIAMAAFVLTTAVHLLVVFPVIFFWISAN